MSIAARIIIFCVGIIFFVTVLELVRKRRFREELSLIWLFVSIIIPFFAFADYLMDPIANYLKISYPPMLMLIIILFIFTFIIFLFSLVISDLKTKNKELVQKIVLMEFKLEKLKEEIRTKITNDL